MPKLGQERALRAHHVGNGDHGKVRAVRPAGRGIVRRRPRRAAAAAEEIGADDEEAVGVERLAGADHAVPPAQAAAAIGVALLGGEAVARAGGRGRGRVACGVRVAGKRVTHEDHVVARGRERAVGFVGDADGVELAAAVERERARQVEELGLDRADGPCCGVIFRSRGHAPQYTAGRA